MALNVDGLTHACGDLSAAAGVTIEVELEPLGGPGAPVKPAVYAGRRYQEDRRWWGEGDQRRIVDAVVIDNEPSQANRHEAALELLARQVGLPEVVLDLSGVGALPPHLPERISAFRFPHRNADAYLRDALLDGRPFGESSVGAAVFGATADRPRALYEWFPQALLYGFWQSHLGKKRTHAKLARSWFSQVVGYESATPSEARTRTLGLKGDPLNLSVDEAVQYDEDDVLAVGWNQVEGSSKSAEKGARKKKDRLSNLGHGQVPFADDSALAGVSFAAVIQRATVSFAALRRVTTGDADADAAGRAVLVALGLLAHVTAFGRAFSLRSGCDLRPRVVQWTWLGAEKDEDLVPLSQPEAVDLLHSCVEHAESRGLPVGSQWAAEPLVIEPTEALAKAIRSTWPLTG